VSNAVVARNYASALAAVAERHGAGAVEEYGALLDAVAGAVAAEPRVHAVLMSPRVTKQAKRDLLARALTGVAPDPFVRFLGSVVQRGRQGLLGEISAAYLELVDIKLNRVHAGVTTAHAVDEPFGRAIAARLGDAVGKSVVLHFRTDASLLGGLVVRIGDRVFDGSLKRRLAKLRYRLLHAPGVTAE
jgi:F-type H+-transporting ATPase subunit delta